VLSLVISITYIGVVGMSLTDVEESFFRFDDVVEVIKRNLKKYSWQYWTKNTDNKYIVIVLDTRTNTCTIRNRDLKFIRLEDIDVEHQELKEYTNV
jgi:hypothetical protein